jgi:hypothetical protein
MMYGAPGHPRLQKWMKDHIKVVIVSTIASPAIFTDSPGFFNFLDEIEVAYQVLEHPCVPVWLTCAQSKTVAQAEWAMVFERSHWDHIVRLEAYDGAAIAVAHLRSLSQCLHMGYSPCCMIIEDDCVLTADAEIAFLGSACALMDWEEDPCDSGVVDCIWGAHSAHAVSHIATVGESTVIHKQNHGLSVQFSLRVVKEQQKGKGSRSNRPRQRMAWFGQGARCYMVTAEFARQLLHTPVTSWYDVHIVNMIEKNHHLGVLAFPPMVRHEVDPTRMDRGSGRLCRSYGGADHVDDNIVFISFSDQNVGTFNRVRTAAFCLYFAHMHGLGVVIEWHRKNASEPAFTDLFAFDYEMLLKTPNVKSFDVRSTLDKDKKQMIAAFERSSRTVATFRFQCELQIAVEYCHDTWEQEFPNRPVLKYVLQSM